MPRPAVTRLLVAGSVVPLLVTSLALPTAAADPAPSFTGTTLPVAERISGDKTPSSRLAQTDPALLGRTDSTVVDVVVKLDVDSAAAYAGGVEGLAATSPSVTGESLTGDSAAEVAYEDYQEDAEADVVADLAAAVPSLQVGTSLRTVYGGFAARVPANQVEAVLAVDGVSAVQTDTLNQLLTDSSADFIGASPVYDTLGGVANAGEGVIYGNLDSGVWPEHPSFADQGNLAAPPGPARACDYGDNPLTPETDVFVCNNKLIGGETFLDGYLSNPVRAAAEPFRTTRDSNGHGTHTASTSAGNIVEDVSVLGSELAPIHGIAPGAWVMEYKVCGIQGCFGSDTAAAVQQAILDGVDVINYSISGGTNPFTDPTELAFLDAYAAGVFVSASAGNDGPGASTANHLAPWLTTVAASTQTRAFTSTLSLTAANGDTFTAEGASITPGAGPAPVVLNTADPLCQVPAAAGTFDGEIVACVRGGNARVDKGFNVLAGGAVGMVLFNPALADVETDTHWLPAVHLADGTAFAAFMDAHADVTGSFTAGAASEGQGDVMAAFSSRGPAGLFLKPDVTAPGVEILAGDTPISEGTESGPAGEYFQAIAGTSMSSPHVAGAAILGAAVHPTWTPGQLKSALMTTALTDVLKEDLTTPADPFDMGAGRIQVDRAQGVRLTMDETAENFFAMGGDPVTAVNLNIPSVNAPVMPGRLTTTRVLTNPTSRSVTVRTSTVSPAGGAVEVTPRQATIAAGGSVTLTIVLRDQSASGEQKFGEVRVRPTNGGPAMHLPVAYIPTQGTVSLSQDCTRDVLLRKFNQRSVCTVTATNEGGADQVVNFTTNMQFPLRPTAATGGATITGKTVSRSNVTLSGALPGVPSVGEATDTPGGGYLPLEAFGIDTAPIGDEDMLNLDVPAFEFNGRTFTSVGIDSNGYLVAGGGTAVDNNCCDLPTGPDAAAPNNVMAPFWTDLDGTGAPGVAVGSLTDGVDSWIVVEYQVYVWGTDDLRTFQVWIGTNGVQDVSYEYAEPMTDPSGQDFLVGAENSLGAGQMESVLPTDSLRVTSTDPTPGATASYTYTVMGTTRGTGETYTRMTANGIAGDTVVSNTIAVRWQ